MLFYSLHDKLLNLIVVYQLNEVYVKNVCGQIGRVNGR